MHPTALMLACIHVIPAVEIAHKMAVEAPIQDAFYHRLGAAVVILVIANRILAGRREGPDVAILTIFPPGGFIAVQDWRGARLGFERVYLALERAPHRMQQFNYFACTDCQLVDGTQIGLDAADGQAQALGQKRHQTGNSYADAALAQHLSTQIEGRTVPLSAVWTKAFNDAMFDHLDGLRLWQLNHLTSVVQAITLEQVVAGRAAVERVRHGAGGCHAATALIVFGRAPFAHALWFCRRRFVRLDERWQLRRLLLQCRDTGLGGSQL